MSGQFIHAQVQQAIATLQGGKRKYRYRDFRAKYVRSALTFWAASPIMATSEITAAKAYEEAMISQPALWHPSNQQGFIKPRG
jgi:hypothetical protein